MVALCAELDSQFQCELLVELRKDYLSVSFSENDSFAILRPQSSVGNAAHLGDSEPNSARMEILSLGPRSNALTSPKEALRHR